MSIDSIHTPPKLKYRSGYKNILSVLCLLAAATAVVGMSKYEWLGSSQTRLVNQVVASDGSLWEASDSLDEIVRSEDNGESWSVVFTLPRGEVVDISIRAGGDAVATNHLGAIWQSTDNGVTWRQTNEGARRKINAVAWADSTTAVAVGPGGLILRTADGGTAWQRIDSGVKEDLYGASFATPHQVWVSGAKGRLLCSENAGHSWRPIASGTASTLSHIAFLNEQHGLAVGADGVITRTRNAGLRWHEDESKFDGPIDVARIRVTGEHMSLLATDGQRFVSRNGGELWVQVPDELSGKMLASVTTQSAYHPSGTSRARRVTTGVTRGYTRSSKRKLPLP